MTNESYINLKEKRDIGHVINASFSFLKISYFKMIGNLLLFAAPLFIIGAIISSGCQYVAASTYGNTYYVFFQPEYYYGLFFDFLGYVMTYTIVTNYILQYTKTDSVKFDNLEIMTNVKNDFLKVLVVNFLYWLVSLGGLILLLVPGIYYSISNALSRSILIVDKKSISGSLGESRRLVNDNWWRTFGLFYIVYFLTAMIGFIFVIPSVVLAFIIKLHLRTGDLEDYHIMYTLSIVVTNLGTCLIYPITVTALTVFTFSLQEEKDQVTLVESIESIGSETVTAKEDEGSY